MNPEKVLEAQIEAWKTAIETQRHFNDVAMKVRHFGFVLVAAVVGAAGFSLRSGFELNIPYLNFSIPVASSLFVGSALLWWFIWFLDAKWYTPFLKGAVIAGTRLEVEINKSVPEFSLCRNISEASQKVKIRDKGRTFDSKQRSNVFHFGMIYTLILIALVIAAFDNTEAINLGSHSSTEKTEQIDASELNNKDK